ncbi:MAG TPA: LysM peptidoglycan-binding domain-containing protein [Jatrophihabitans sp.]|uniref:LysM peptidoglycan-binding domain-containing protein n=1 Tax=Jatrophihabitans sp. TaxID=1932789 RepID=UPI002EFAD568
MSVATEFPPAAPIPARARQLPRAGAAAPPADRPRLWLVPPGERCAPSSGRWDGARRGTGRVARPSVRLISSARTPAQLVPVGSSAARVQSRPLRLTRRGVVAIALGVAVVGGLLLLVAHLSASPSAAAPAAPAGAVVTVQPGDTLWSIAGQVAPGRDPRAVVERIRESNNLTSVSLIPGQALKVG